MNWLVSFVVTKVKDYVLKNWKTTLAGVLGGILVKYLPGIDEGTRASIIAVVLAALGTLAKDGDKSGTVEQPRTDPALVKAQNAAVAIAAEAPVGSDAG